MSFRRFQVIVALLVALPLCSATVARAALPAAGCSWAGETDQRDVNIGAPDLDAYYWLTPITAVSGTKVEISGEYPRARYFSLTLYNTATLPIGSLYDQQIDPDHGSANPFRGPIRAGSAEDYHVQLVFSDAPKSPAPNTLYAGTPSGPGGIVLLELRVYVPRDPSQPQGSVPFPQLTTETSGGTPLVTEGACSVTPPSFGATFWETYAEANSSPGPATPAHATPSWSRAFGSQFGNPQNAYLTTTASQDDGQLLVIHTRAPTFPNTDTGQPVYGHYQLRYWSICTYDSSGQAAFGCAADYHAAIRGGAITYVVSDPAQRPSNATAANGVTWLPWGPSDSVQVVYRNMLPAPWFHQAAESITAPSQSAAALMGPYYPTAAYCSTAAFERGGWQACLPAAKSSGRVHKRHKRHKRRKRKRRPHRRRHKSRARKRRRSTGAGRKLKAR